MMFLGLFHEKVGRNFFSADFCDLSHVTFYSENTSGSLNASDYGFKVFFWFFMCFF